MRPDCFTVEFDRMISECSNVFDMFSVVEKITELAPQGVSYQQLMAALDALSPKASA